MHEIQKETSAGQIQGRYAPNFEPVVDAFLRNFAEQGEVGASVCITQHGATVVDLWGGVKDQAAQTPWEEDTMCVVF